MFRPYHNTSINKGYWGIPTTTSPPHEKWFEYSPYIAEFWSTLSCAGFFVISFKGLMVNNSDNLYIYLAIGLCGIASALSHITVKRSMLWFDYLGIVCNGLALMTNLSAVTYTLYNTNIVYAGLLTGLMGMWDVYNKYHAVKKYPFVHSLWHLSVAYMMSHFIY